MVNINKIKGRMKEMELTQKEVAEKLGVDTSTLNRKLNDTSGARISILELLKLKEILKIHEKELNEFFFNN